MRNLLLATTLLASACDSFGEAPEPPVLRVVSPQRSLIRDGAGALLVSGTVGPNSEGVPVKKITVNDVQATVNVDGTWSAQIDLRPGATLINTVAIDDHGGKAEDTRSVEAGPIRAPNSNIDNALTTAISANAFAKIASAAGTIIKGTDFRPMLASMNPVMDVGGGPDCLYAQLTVDNFTMTNATITLRPVAGGLSFSAKIDGVDVPGRAKYAVACISGSNSVRVQASSALISGTLLITPDGMNGFKTDLANPVVQLQGLNISASGLAGEVLDMINLDGLIQKLAPTVAKHAMGPLVNKALGGLGGPKELNVLGKTMVLQVSPSAIVFDPNGGLVTLNTTMFIKDTTSKGFIFTDNGMPTMDPGQGLQLGVADDLANSMLSQLVATGLLQVHMPADGGTFDGNEVSMTSPPMVSADPANGMMRLILPDMVSTFTLQGRPVAKAAINATVELKITPSQSGYGIAIQLGEPVIKADTLEDIPNETMLTDDDLATAVELCLNSQIATVGALLGAIPLPAMPGGLTMKDMSITSDDGYVMMKGTLE